MDAERIFFQYGAQMLRHAQLLLGENALAEDVVQEALIRVMKSPLNLEDERQERAWLLRVVGNLCRDEFRRARRRGEVPLAEWMDVADEGPMPEEEAATRERDGELLRAVLRLPLKYREAVLMAYYHELDGREAALALGVTQAAFRARLARARKKLESLLKEEVLL